LQSEKILALINQAKGEAAIISIARTNEIADKHTFRTLLFGRLRMQVSYEEYQDNSERHENCLLHAALLQCLHPGSFGAATAPSSDR
jgi:hypothetical protein